MTDEEYYANVLSLLVAIETERKAHNSFKARYSFNAVVRRMMRAEFFEHVNNTDRLSKLLAEETERRVIELKSGRS